MRAGNWSAESPLRSGLSVLRRRSVDDRFFLDAGTPAWRQRQRAGRRTPTADDAHSTCMEHSFINSYESGFSSKENFHPAFVNRAQVISQFHARGRSTHSRCLFALASFFDLYHETRTRLTDCRCEDALLRARGEKRPVILISRQVAISNHENLDSTNV